MLPPQRQLPRTLEHSNQRCGVERNLWVALAFRDRESLPRGQVFDFVTLFSCDTARTSLVPLLLRLLLFLRDSLRNQILRMMLVADLAAREYCPGIDGC